jgi:broad specificity phosphatase PhoE
VADTNPAQVKLYLIRHGQTEWSLSGQHTGKTDIPLTEDGRNQARLLQKPLSKLNFSTVLSSPRSRASETAKLAGFQSEIKLCDELAELDYGDYEGLTTLNIRESVPEWTVWTHGCPNGETLDHAAERCRKVISIAYSSGGNVLIFAHAHILRILTATWLQLPPSEARHFILDTSTLSVLSYERETPAIKMWNCSINN